MARPRKMNFSKEFLERTDVNKIKEYVSLVDKYRFSMGRETEPERLVEMLRDTANRLEEGFDKTVKRVSAKRIGIYEWIDKKSKELRNTFGTEKIWEEFMILTDTVHSIIGDIDHVIFRDISEIRLISDRFRVEVSGSSLREERRQECKRCEDILGALKVYLGELYSVLNDVGYDYECECLH